MQMGSESPHPYLSFSLPLACGWSQVTEVQYHGQTLIPKPCEFLLRILKLLGPTFDSSLSLLERGSPELPRGPWPPS